MAGGFDMYEDGETFLYGTVCNTTHFSSHQVGDFAFTMVRHVGS